MAATRAWPHAVLADLDGTLIDSAADVADAANTALARFDIQTDAAQIRAWLGDGARALVDKAITHAGLVVDTTAHEAATADFVRAYAATPCRKTTVFPGAAQALGELRRRGIAVAVCSNKPQAVAQAVLEQTGLATHVSVLAGGGDLPLKPAPDALLACLRELDVGAFGTVYIGDLAVDVAAARAAGCPVLVTAFGYSQIPATQLGADGILPCWRNLPAALDRLAAVRGTPMQSP